MIGKDENKIEFVLLIRSAIIVQIENLVIDVIEMSSLEYLDGDERCLMIGTDENSLDNVFN